MSDKPESKDEANAPEASKKPSAQKSSGFSGTAVGLLGFIIALGGGFFLGKWIRKPDSAPVTIADGERYKVKLRGDEPSKGGAEALVTIIEFADYQCPYCGQAVEPLEEVLDDYGDDIRLIYKHYPLPFHPKAPPAARAAWAAHQQGKFWEMHEYLFKAKADVNNVRAHAEKLGMDAEKFALDMISSEAGEMVDDDFFAGGLVGVTGTPAFIVNGHPYKGKKDAGQWRQIIDAEMVAARQLVDDGTARAQVYDELMEGAVETRGGGKPVGNAPSDRKPARRAGEPDSEVSYRVTADGRPALGPEDALVTVVEFSDFTCRFCSKLGSKVREVVSGADDVRWVFRNYPRGNGAPARKAAKAALAADRQGKFWEMHDRLFAKQSSLRLVKFSEHAEALGLDVEKFEADMADPALDAIIDEDHALGKKFGVSGTPAAFVNGRYVRGAQPVSTFNELIAQEREKAQALVDAGTPRDQVFGKVMESAATSVETPVEGG